MYVGVDVGSGSVRAVLYCSSTKRVLGSSSLAIAIHKPQRDHFEQSCSEIWAAVCHTVREVTRETPQDQIRGIGFDATCSLVLVDNNGEPLPITAAAKSPQTHPKPALHSRGSIHSTCTAKQESAISQTCLMWMDHRAELEATEINSKTSDVKKFVGGGFSPEQQPPKLLWIKRNLPEVWAHTAHFFDLPDWLTYRATGSSVRSLCSVTCKWGYVKGRGGWDEAFLETAGLEDLKGCAKLGNNILVPGDRVPGGLSVGAAKELGLLAETPVAVSMIDAHAGTVGMLRFCSRSITSALCVISGTSTCIMGLFRGESKFVKGIWGPYEGAILPETWLFEGGQTAAGSALDRIVKSHPAYNEDVSYTQLNRDLGGNLTCPKLHKQTEHLHIVPDLHGNRSPLALPSFRGMICGLDLDDSYSSLLSTYLCALQGLALGVKWVIDRLAEHDINYTQIIACGGLADNPCYRTALACATKLPVLAPRAGNLMCVGAAMCAQAAAGGMGLEEVVRMGVGDSEVTRSLPLKELSEFYERKYRVYRRMCEDQI